MKPVALGVLLCAVLSAGLAQATVPALETVSAEPAPPARPPIPRAKAEAPLPWERHVEVGGDLALVHRPTPGGDSAVHYKPTFGFGVHARWDIARYLQFSTYFVDADHTIDLPEGALGLPGKLTIDPVETFSFGARLMPTLPITPRLRAWVSGGIGWGRLEFGRMQVEEPGKSPYLVRERSDSFIEYPLGIGAAFEIIPRWLSIHVELTGAFVSDQHDDALDGAQTIDADGKKRQVGPFPGLDSSFTQTLGLSLIL